MTKFEKRQINGPSNIGLFASDDILKDTVIFREVPFYSFGMEKVMHYMLKKNPTGHPELDKEIRELQLRINVATRNHENNGSSFGEEYPPESRLLLDRLQEIITETAFESESKNVQEKWMALHDAHQHIRKNTSVGIFGLSSEKGKTINGSIAHCIGFDKSKKRYIVEHSTISSKAPEKLLLKKENIKTVSGIVRSNIYQEGLFENRCRLNHSCNGNTKTCTISEYNKLLGRNLIATHSNECITFAKEDIKAGEELTCSYLCKGAGKRLQIRREELYEKYKFFCKCDTCVKEENN